VLPRISLERAFAGASELNCGNGRTFQIRARRFTAERLGLHCGQRSRATRMNCPPLELLPCDHLPVCHGYRWRIVDEEKLAELVAWVAVGRSNHAQLVLTSLQQAPKATAKEDAKRQAIRRLTVCGAVTQEHRDGWVFQIISWIAACIQSGGNVATSLPHQQLAAKGFDGLLVPLTAQGKSFETLTVCEDKATANPRKTITQKVWPELASVEAGDRDAELQDGLAAILQRHHVPDVERLLESVHWEDKKHYRVSMTVSDGESEDNERAKLFKGYDGTIDGPDAMRRRAETLSLLKLRDWMDQFCKRVIAVIKTL